LTGLSPLAVRYAEIAANGLWRSIGRIAGEAADELVKEAMS